jgi:hypothetical protein
MKLTEEERRLLQKVKLADKWETLWWELSCVIPCFILVGVGIWNDSLALAFTGLGVFLFFRLRADVYHARQIPVFKSLCEKFEQTIAAN